MENEQNNFMTERFNKIMELKIEWELGEISKDVFMKSTRNHVMECSSFKNIHKKREISAIKIQQYWREYNKKKEIIEDLIYNESSDSASEWWSGESDPLEQTIHIWNDSWKV